MIRAFLILFIASSAGAATLTNWQASLTRILAGTNEQALIKIIGDSWTQFGFITDDTKTNLQGKYGNAGPGWATATQTGKLYTNQVIPVLAGTWTGADPAIDSSDTATPATMTWTTNFVTATIGYKVKFGDGSTDSFRVRTNGVQAASVKNPSGTSFDIGVVAVPSGTAGSCALQVRINNAFTWLFGVEFRSGSPGVVFDSYGYSGRTAADWVSMDPTFDFWVSNTVPTVTAIMLGVNDVDLGHFAGGEMASNLQYMITRAKAVAPNSDILLISPADVAVTNGGFSMKSVNDLMAAMAPTNGCGFFSGYTNMPGYQAGFTAGYYADARHLNALGSYVLSTNLAAYLDTGTPPSSSPNTALSVQSLTLLNATFR